MMIKKQPTVQAVVTKRLLYLLDKHLSPIVNGAIRQFESTGARLVRAAQVSEQALTG